MERCPLCGGELKKNFDSFEHVYSGIKIKLSDIPGLICTDCGEELVDSIYGKIIEESIEQYREFTGHKYDDLLTCDEVATLLSVSYQVVTTMLSDGKLPGTKIGREWRIPYGILIDYIQSMSVNNLSDPEKDVFQTFFQLKKNFFQEKPDDL